MTGVLARLRDLERPFRARVPESSTYFAVGSACRAFGAARYLGSGFHSDGAAWPRKREGSMP